ncbi:MAG: AAA family ATPase, partial [Syntrophomonas sp.]
MALKPWYKVVTPREDLREGRPLDASEFAVHLDQIRDGRAPIDYQDPRRFFERTYLTQNLIVLAAETVRRLSGITTETSAVFNMATQFGGGKTHALSVLYHLARSGPEADNLTGVRRILEKAGINTVPQASVAVFVGTEFDSLTGRGGDDGTPKRKTPWGEIAFQLGGAEGFAQVAEHDRREIAPAGDVIRKILPDKTPCLILMDELMNHVSRNRKSGLASQFYDFMQNLSETVRGMKNVVLAVSIPASELEMTADDQSDYDRFKKLLDRIGKPIFMSAESETAEIIRRRLFEWGGLPDDGRKVCVEYADWIIDNRTQLPDWFSTDPREAFLASYPFHPSVLSVFERKWQVLPRFQQTRGILRLLALWVSRAYQEGFKGAHRDHLIGLGTAPLDEPLFQAAVFEQLGESKLIGAVTTDICGKRDAHALRLDKESVEAIKKARLHRKVATSIFFESNGGMANAEATIPEIRLAVSDPEQDIANVETVLDNLTSNCYFLSTERNRYRFGIKPNLIKLLADRRANIKDEQINKRVREQVEKVFAEGIGVERAYFPAKSSAVADRAILNIAVLDPENSLQDKKTLNLVDEMTRSYGTSSRTFKSAIIWAIADSDTAMKEEARKLLAWEEIKQDKESLRLDESQIKELETNLQQARRDIKESIWRSYKNVAFLGKDNKIRLVDMGLIHSSASTSMLQLILNRLMQDGDITDGISAAFLVRN